QESRWWRSESCRSCVRSHSARMRRHSLRDEARGVADEAGVVGGNGIDGCLSDLGRELGHVVEPARRLATTRDRTGVRALEKRRGDGALDHVTGDDGEAD